MILVPGVLESSSVSYSSPLTHSGVWSGQEWALDLEGNTRRCYSREESRMGVAGFRGSGVLIGEFKSQSPALGWRKN